MKAFPPTIGARLWLRDDNHRVYEKTKDGIYGRLVLRGSFRPFRIVGFSGRSYIVRSDNAVGHHADRRVGAASLNKPRSASDGGYFVTDEVRELALWKDANANDLERAVRECQDLDALRRAAAAVGFIPAPVNLEPMP